MDQLLVDILQYKRNYMSDSEFEFLDKYINQIPGIEFDAEMNFWVRIGEDSRTMFSCHTDTVHRTSGMQTFYDFEDIEMAAKTTVTSDEAYDGECLGADDGVGIWIMMKMIEAEVPGLYVFHRGEEMGGIGSQYILKENRELLNNIDRAIAFDRMGDTDIITSQAGQECCSKDFAEALGKEIWIEDSSIKLRPADGVFTDTAVYVGVIPECTNLSVGYMFEHTVNEELDYGFASKLLDACIAINWEALPTVRIPIDVYTTEGYNLDNPYGDQGTVLQYDDALDLCERFPAVIAELLIEKGITYEEVEFTHDDLYGLDSNDGGMCYYG